MNYIQEIKDCADYVGSAKGAKDYIEECCEESERVEIVQLSARRFAVFHNNFPPEWAEESLTKEKFLAGVRYDF